MKTNDFALTQINKNNLGGNGLATVFMALDKFVYRVGLAARSLIVSSLIQRDYDYTRWLVDAHLCGYEFADPPAEELQVFVEEDEEEELIPGNLGPGYIDEDPYEGAVESVLSQAGTSSMEKDPDMERAIDILVDTVFAVFEEEDLVNDDGVFRKGEIVPWAKRSKLKRRVKSCMLSLIEETDPPVFFKNSSNLWQYDFTAYPDTESAKQVLIAAYKNVGNVNVGSLDYA